MKGIPCPKTRPPNPKHRSAPVRSASPEFAAARIIRDLRVIDERKAKLTATYREKMEALDRHRAELDARIPPEIREAMDLLSRVSAAEVKS